MGRRIIVSLVAAVALAVSALASTAGATITITQAPAGPGYQNLSPFNCGGKTFYLTPHYVTDPNGNMFQVQGSGLPIRLGFGWAAHTGITDAAVLPLFARFGFDQRHRHVCGLVGRQSGRNSVRDPAGNRLESARADHGHSSRRHSFGSGRGVLLPRRALARTGDVHPESNVRLRPADSGRIQDPTGAP